MLAKVDAAPRAFDGSGAADPLAFASLAAHRTPRGSFADVIAFAAMVDAQVGIHALTIALGKTRLAGDLAAPVAHGFGVRRRRAWLLAPATMFGIRIGIDANARTIELRLGTFTLALARGAHLALRAALAASTAMIRVGEHVHAGTVAHGGARVASDAARPIHTGGFGIRRSVTTPVASTAMIRVASEVTTSSGAQAETSVAVEIAGAPIAVRTAVTRRNTLRPALAAVKHAELQIDAGSRTGDQAGGTVRRARTFGAHFAGRANRATGTAVSGVAG